ncbi:Zn(II)2Cys6 transcription factor [Aspergillus affinis]|uniref:Zn(II)2Cys6 transcription factor n=1 Tax=Aspergillus affinis TaxID=1070780 RepID=UPI0022FE4892|nr:putative C6 finger domain protein [Aspergillus affinis]KAI9035766.1 putative C6 finger domain protein [Aspergillus affinis]
MEEIKIPSPSAILDIPPAVSSAGAHSKASSTSAQRTNTSPITNKPKKSKSRNGCITCKTKRLKCDESKPTCLQCKKRNVDCGGYKKDFKWRPFEETNVAQKTAVAKSKKGRHSCSELTAPSDDGPDAFSTVSSSPPSHRRTNSGPAAPPAVTRSKARAVGQTASPTGSPVEPRKLSSPGKISSILNASPSHSSGSLPQTDITQFADEFLTHHSLGSLGEDITDITAPSLAEITPSDQSPWFSDISFPILDPETSPDRVTVATSEEDVLQDPGNFSFEALLEGDNDDIEEIVRQSDRGMGPPIPGLGGPGFMSHLQRLNAPPELLQEPRFGIAAPEMLVLQFDRVTCGILSIKDGAHENPWRTLIWPLAKDTPALYHAVFALAAFHSSKQVPGLRVLGVDHMRQSITCMVQDIQNMRTDAALATSLALAFADTWDQHTRTCIQHLRGAKALVSQVIGTGLQSGMSGTDLERVRFLYNTWLYMDVIARLTSQEDSGNSELDLSVLQPPSDAVHEIDPLMGCATTLFPIIDRVVRLIQRVRKTESNSISLVSQAIELKRLVEQWEPPDWFEPPEDPTSEVQHSIQTAHAYRWATLLYLHQAVPEMPSESAPELAKRVLLLLATVPPSSRTTIIQMFPLLAAGCEAEQEEDREWVMNRWTAIQTRLMLGSIDRCIEVVREVWTRRDAFAAEKQRRQARAAGRSNSQGLPRDAIGKDGLSFMGSGSGDRSPSKAVYGKDPWRRPSTDERAVPSRISSVNARRASTASPLENIEFEKTVRGSLHWVNVMQDWGWEGESTVFSVSPSPSSVPGRGDNEDDDDDEVILPLARYDRRDSKYGSKSLVMATVVILASFASW